MDHASELEVIPLSSGIDDIDILNKPKSHPFSSPLRSKSIPIVNDIKNAINKLHKNGKHNPNHPYIQNQKQINNKNPITNTNKSDKIDNKLTSVPSLLSPRTHKIIRIIAPSMAFFGCQFAWACQGGYVDPYLRELGLPNDMMNYAWILGPISGMIFQPMIGVFSDHCESSYGRRRPYFLLGAGILSVCLLIFSHSSNIGAFFGDNTTHIALFIAFICFWLLDFSTNFMEGPLRALCSDTLTQTEQLQSNSWFGIMNGLASTLGFALGYFTNDITIIFGIASFIVIISSMATSLLVNEKQHFDDTKNHNKDSIKLQQMSSDEELGSNNTDKNTPQPDVIAGVVSRSNNNTDDTEDEEQDAITIPNGIYVNALKSEPQELHDHRDDIKKSKCTQQCDHINNELRGMVYGIFHMPSVVSRCWIVQFCTYFSNFALWVYLTDYFGENIMGGNATSESEKEVNAYNAGVEYGNLAFCFISGISAIFSLLATRLVGIFGLKKLWILCLLCYSFVMIISPLLSSLTLSLLLFSLAGLPMGASFTLPWAVVSSYSTKKDPNNAGLWLTSLNIAECGPELTVGLLGGFIVDRFKGNVSSVFFCAGIVNLLAAFLVLKVDTSIYDGNIDNYGIVNNGNQQDDDDETDDDILNEIDQGQRL